MNVLKDCVLLPRLQATIGNASPEHAVTLHHNCIVPSDMLGINTDVAPADRVVDPDHACPAIS